MNMQIRMFFSFSPSLFTCIVIIPRWCINGNRNTNFSADKINFSSKNTHSKICLLLPLLVPGERIFIQNQQLLLVSLNRSYFFDVFSFCMSPIVFELSTNSIELCSQRANNAHNKPTTKIAHRQIVSLKIPIQLIAKAKRI